MKNNKKFDARRLKYGGLSIAITAAFLAVVILINVVVGVASDKFPLTMDLTQDKVFALTQSSIDYLGTLEKPVEITVLSDELTLDSSGGYYTQAKNIIDQYGKHGKNVTVSYVNPTVNPGFVSLYPDLNLTQFDILVSSGDKQVKVALNSLFNLGFDQNTYQQYIKSSKAEQEITSAVMRVTADKAVKVLLLTGQDQTYSAELQDLLTKNGYEVAQQSLLTGELDQSADIAFMLAPQRDLDLEVVKKLDAFLENGGSYGKQLFYAPHATAPAAPNLNAFLAQWGVKLGDGLVMESDPQRYVNGMPYLCLTDFTSQDYTANLATSAPVLSPLGRELSTTFENQSGYSTQVLLSYSAGSYLMPADADQNWQPSKADLAARPALVRSSFTQYEGTTAKTSNLFTAASSASFDAISLMSNSVANAEYYLAMLGELSQRTDIISVAPKNLSGKELGINQEQFIFFGGLFTILLPLAVIIAGLVIWLRRRNR